MDRAEAIRELKQWHDQMKKHGVPDYGKKLIALDLAIEALKAEPRQHHLGKHADITVIDEAATHDKRTETHACVGETHGDLISREEAMGAVQDHFNADGFRGYYDGQKMMDRLKALPSAATDMSEYSDRLWKAAYERGKEDGHQLSEETSTFIEWLLTEVLDEDNWELNAVALGEIICRKMTKMGFLTVNDDGSYVRASVTPTERTGEWIKVGHDIYECSLCHQNVMTFDIEAYKFCHGCGAKMGGDTENPLGILHPNFSYER